MKLIKCEGTLKVGKEVKFIEYDSIEVEKEWQNTKSERARLQALSLELSKLTALQTKPYTD